MALDEVRLDGVAAGRRPPLLRFWGWTEPTLVLGSNQSVANEVDEDATALRGFTITRRLSGGGTMLAEPGRTITWSLAIPAEAVAGMSFVESFAHLDRWAVETLRGLGVDAGYRPLNDIVSPAGKIAGAAQARRRGAVLHHVTMAYSMDPAVLRELIRVGRPSLSEKGVRSANKVVTPLDTLTTASREEVVEALAAAAGAEEGRVTPAELEDAAELAARKYARRGWTHRLP
jgi:lipoate-protein ligase A